jgi:hypothetical protein
MLRQLAALTYRVPGAGPKALAVAVYLESDGQLLQAQERGLEGVACVDDTARAYRLPCQLWATTGNPALRTWADGLLDFVLWMKAGDGEWFNFIYDWDGTRNAGGPTSLPGVNFWQARATAALADAALLLGDGRARRALGKALFAAAASPAPPDVRVLHVLTALELLGVEADPWLSKVLGRWCDEIASCRSGVVLMNSPDERGQPHLWGHEQEAALIEAAVVMGRDDFNEIAIRSADAVFLKVIESGFDLSSVRPYDVQSTILVMDRLAQRTGDRKYFQLGAMSRAWFDGRNSAGVPTYDRRTGRAYDGIDDGRVNHNSGAEANISAGLALWREPFVLELARNWAGGGTGPAIGTRRVTQGVISGQVRPRR